LNIRKEKREGSLLAKRRENTVDDDEKMTICSSADISEDILNFLGVLKDPSANVDATYLAVRGIRCLLSVSKDIPVAQVLDSGALPFLINLLHCEDDRINFEAVWALTNIASTSYTSAVASAVPSIVPLLVSVNENVREQAAWCLGNIAGDSTALRDDVLKADAMTYIVMNIKNPANESLLGNMVWSVSNLCRGRPLPKWELVEEALLCLTRIILDLEPLQFAPVLLDACWAVSYLSDGENERIQKVVETGIIPKLVEFLSDPSLVTPALKVLANIVSGSDEQTQAVLDCKVLDKVPKLLQSTKSIRKDTCWMLSNIAAGNVSQIHEVCKKAVILSPLVTAIRSSEWEIRKEAIWAAYNIAAGGNDGHVVSIVFFGAIENLCENLCGSDTEIIMAVLNTLDNILKVGKRQGKAYECLVEEAGGVDKIEELQQHRSDAIYVKARSILEQYFQSEEADIVDENIAPSSIGGSYEFCVPQKLFLDDNNENISEKKTPFSSVSKQV